MTLLITGGAGFIGSNLVRLALERGHEVVTLDALTYAGSEENLIGLNPDQHRFIHGNITNKETVEQVIRDGFHGRPFNAVINCAAETHVDRSLIVAAPFADSNVLGTAVLLETSRHFEIPIFLQVSTDEVYGSITGDGKFTRRSPLHPSSPYSASKAGADLFALSFVHSWNYDVRITRCTNNYGPYQFPEKFIPVSITNALLGKKIPVYGDGLNIRDWIFVRDHCEGILSVIDNGKAGVVYHFGGSNELTNIDLCTRILKSLAHQLGKDEAEFLSLITYVEDRPGHDRRYALDWSDSEIEIGWTPTASWEQGLQSTVGWYLQHRNWWSSKL